MKTRAERQDEAWCLRNHRLVPISRHWTPVSGGGPFGPPGGPLPVGFPPGVVGPTPGATTPTTPTPLPGMEVVVVVVLLVL